MENNNNDVQLIKIEAVVREEMFIDVKRHSLTSE